MLADDSQRAASPSADAGEDAIAQVWAALAKASEDGLVVVSPTGQIIAMNERFGAVWGLPQHVLAARDDERALAAANERVADPDLRHLAETLQASLLPPRPPTIPGLEMAARYHAAHQSLTVGGDFYDVFRLRTNDWGIVLGDVCGKGVHAARLTALARYSLRSAAGHHTAPADILSELNATLLTEEDLGERIASAIYACLEQDVCGAWITLAVAGHPLPVVVRRAGWIDVRGQSGSLLGLFEDIDVAEDRVGLGPGDAIVFFTDGVTEARNAAGEEYGEEALPDALLANTTADA